MNIERVAVEAYERERPEDTDFAFYVTAHVRMCARQEDAEHWLEDYRKAGIDM